MFSGIYEIVLIKKIEREGRAKTEAEEELDGWKTLPAPIKESQRVGLRFLRYRFNKGQILYQEISYNILKYTLSP